MDNEIRSSIKTVYGMIWNVLALYEETNGYNFIPGEKDFDIQDYMEKKLLEIRETIIILLGEKERIKNTLLRIVYETEQFVKSYEIPGVVTRWKRINPQILFFEGAFDLMETCPDIYKEISLGLTDLRMSCYPDETIIAARKRYFAQAKKFFEDKNIQYSEARVFQNELLRTITLVFKNDFKKYL
ncbi:hypothetical protein [Faecalimonas sp.]